MLPKVHLTSLCRMSGCSWVMPPSWLCGSSRSLLYSSVYSCHLSLISIASEMVRIFSVLYCTHLCMKYSLGISNFLKEISILSHYIVSLYFFSLFTLEVFLISPCYSLELCIQMGISFSFSPLPLASLLFSALCKASSDKPFCLSAFHFGGWFWSWLPVQCP